jgi:hypothetical protein
MPHYPMTGGHKSGTGLWNMASRADKQAGRSRAAVGVVGPECQVRDTQQAETEPLDQTYLTLSPLAEVAAFPRRNECQGL